MTEKTQQWSTWDQVEARAKRASRLDEAKVAEYREQQLDAQRAYRLAEIRKHAA